jgi:N-methylhydantoinase A
LKLLAFGGAGPMLATQIARELQMDHVVIPPIAGNFSAWGLLGADLVRSAGRTERLPLTHASLSIVNERLAELRNELASRRGAFDASSLDTTLEVGLAMRFRGQEHSLTIPVRLSGDALADDVETIGAEFRAAYQRDFGVMLSNDIEIFAIRCALRKPLPRRNLNATKHGSGGAVSAIQRVYSFAAGRMVDATTLARDDLRAGIAYEGPAIIYEETTTTYVDADCTYRVDDSGCMHLVRKGNLNA